MFSGRRLLLQPCWVLWVTAWFLYTTDTPTEHPKITSAEVQYIEAHMLTQLAWEALVLAILATPSVSSLHLIQARRLYRLDFICGFPLILSRCAGSPHGDGRHRHVQRSAAFWDDHWRRDLDRLLRNGYGARNGAGAIPGLCTGLAMPLLLAAVLAPSTTLPVALFVFSIFFFSVRVGFLEHAAGIGAAGVGAVGGVMNTTGNFAGVFGPAVAGFIITYSAAGSPLLFCRGCGFLSCIVLMHW